MKKLEYLLYLLPVAALAFVATTAAGQMRCGGGHDHSTHAAEHARHETVEPVGGGDPYLLGVDPVTGKPLPKEPVVTLYKGRELRFAEKATRDAFMKSPEKYLDTLDALMIKDQLPFYSLKTCPVSGEKLGEMGPPVDRLVGNRLVRLCCTGCVSKLEKNPDKYLGALDEAVIQAQKGSYPLKTCVVSGEELGAMGDPVDMVLGNRLVRLCCTNCEKTLKADPLKYLDKLSRS